MDDQTRGFLERSHRAVVDHYRRLLASHPTMPLEERLAIERRRREAEILLQQFVGQRQILRLAA